MVSMASVLHSRPQGPLPPAQDSQASGLPPGMTAPGQQVFCVLVTAESLA